MVGMGDRWIGGAAAYAIGADWVPGPSLVLEVNLPMTMIPDAQQRIADAAERMALVRRYREECLGIRAVMDHAKR